MSGESIELFPRCRFKFSNLVAGQTLEVPVVRALDVTDFADATLVVRVHASTMGTGGENVQVIVRSVAPTCEDPSVDFTNGTAVATVMLDSNSNAGDLEVAPLNADFGGHLQVRVKGDRTGGSTVDVTLSAELVVRTAARPAALSSAAPADVTKATADVGTSGSAARADHKHDISTATASELTDSTNAEGTAASLARSDHTHSHGSRGGGSLHAAATTSVAGFLSATDKTKLDDLPMVVSAISSNTTASSTPTLYVCNVSSSSLTLTLPAASGNSGLRIGVKLDSISGSNTVTIDGNGTEQIDGDTTVVLYVLRDYLEIVCDGSEWHVVVDGRIGHRCIVRRSLTTQSISNASTTSINFDDAEKDVGVITDVSGSAPDVTIRRTGYYLVSCSINLNGIDTGEKMTLRVSRSGSYINFVNIYSTGSNEELACSLTTLIYITSGQTLDMLVYQNSGTSQNTKTVNEDEPRMTVMEVLPWSV